MLHLSQHIQPVGQRQFESSELLKHLLERQQHVLVVVR